MKYIVGAGEGWTPADFDLDRDTHAIIAKMGPVLDAKDTNLQPFAARGGKLILVHGWSDAAIPARGTIAYYDSVRSRMGPSADGFVRLYLVPGMHHCGGGTGPSDVGGSGVSRLPRDPGADLSAALEAWVENGRAPGPVVARQPSVPAEKPGPSRTALICPYPQRAVLKPGGDMADAASFACARQAAGKAAG